MQKFIQKILLKTALSLGLPTLLIYLGDILEEYAQKSSRSWDDEPAKFLKKFLHELSGNLGNTKEEIEENIYISLVKASKDTANKYDDIIARDLPSILASKNNNEAFLSVLLTAQGIAELTDTNIDDKAVELALTSLQELLNEV